MTDLTHEEMLEIASEREAANQEQFYKFFVCDYFATGEGRSIWLMVDRWYGKGWSDPLHHFQTFIEDAYYYSFIEEANEEKFLNYYANLIPDYVRKMIEKKDQQGFTWQTHLHFNYG
jgi:hypothetical protein